MIGLVIFIFGLFIGSFLNVVLYRVAKQENFISSRSYCPKCKEPILWHDNIPVVSYLILGGKCRKCKNRISFQYPLMEIITGIIFYLSFWQFGFTPNFLMAVILSSFLLMIFAYDLKYYLILDEMTIPAMVLALIFNLYLGYSLWFLLFSAALGGGFFLFQYLISSGKWIGGGDIRLGALMGFILGWKILLVALFLSYLIGAVFGVILLASGKKKMSSEIPFGTFLTLSTFITMFWGSEILGWYLNLLKF